QGHLACRLEDHWAVAAVKQQPELASVEAVLRRELLAHAELVARLAQARQVNERLDLDELLVQLEVASPHQQSGNAEREDAGRALQTQIEFAPEQSLGLEEGNHPRQGVGQRDRVGVL